MDHSTLSVPVRGVLDMLKTTGRESPHSFFPLPKMTIRDQIINYESVEKKVVAPDLAKQFKSEGFIMIEVNKKKHLYHPNKEKGFDYLQPKVAQDILFGKKTSREKHFYTPLFSIVHKSPSKKQINDKENLKNKDKEDKDKEPKKKGTKRKKKKRKQQKKKIWMGRDDLQVHYMESNYKNRYSFLSYDYDPKPEKKITFDFSKASSRSKEIDLGMEESTKNTPLLNPKKPKKKNPNFRYEDHDRKKTIF